MAFRKQSGPWALWCGSHVSPSHIRTSTNNPQAIDPALRDSSGPSESRENSGSSNAYIHDIADANSCPDQSNYGTNAYPSPYPNVSPYAQDASESASSSALRHPANYTRTLVGPLSANACRLLDEHRKEGIFFLFQDLSVRTEGLSRLQVLSCSRC